MMYKCKSSCVVGKAWFAMTSEFSWQNSVSLCPASFCTPRSNLPVTPGISWIPTFEFQSHMMNRTSFLVLVQEGLVGLHRTDQLQLLQHDWLGHRLGLLWYWMVCLGNEPRSFCHFWDYTQVLHFRLFCRLWGLLHFFKKILCFTICRYFLPFRRLFFFVSNLCLPMKKLLSLIFPLIVYFCFCFLCLRRQFQKILLWFMSRSFPHMLSSRNLMVFNLSVSLWSILSLCIWCKKIF